MIDLPFSPPIDIVLDLPVPISINRRRKINWAAIPKLRAWTRAADALTMAAWSGGKRPKEVLNRFEATIVLSETATKVDLDNCNKVIDYAKYLGLIIDDGPRYMRAVHIVWGTAPEGCRLILKPVE